MTTKPTTNKPISEMTTDELLALIKEADSELWAVGETWIHKDDYREYIITKNMCSHINYSYADGRGKQHSGVSTKEAFLENCTRDKDNNNESK